MDSGDIDKLFDDLKSCLLKLIDARVEEKFEPLRAALIHGIEPEAVHVGHMVEAEAIAELIGYDLSTLEKKKKAIQKVYYLARTKAIPSVRLSRRRIIFDIDKVKQKLARGGIS